MRKRLTESGAPGTRWWQWLLMYPTLLVALLGAVPQYLTWYSDWRLRHEFGIEEKTPISAAELQMKLWTKNINCYRNNNLKILQISSGEDFQALICPSGDYWIQYSREGKVVSSQWIAASSAGRKAPGAWAATPPGTYGLQLAQENARTILCQKFLPNRFVVRVTRYPDGHCVEETINPYTGAATSSRTIQCYSC